MIELTLVRHAQPDWEPGGHAVNNPELTDLGHQQASRLGQHFEGEVFDHFFVSPLTRARQTAAPVAEALKQEPEVLSWLEELRLPNLEGSPSDKVHRFLKQANERELVDWWGGYHGGESFRHFKERVSSGLMSTIHENIGARHLDRGPYSLWDLPDQDQRILVVSHLGTSSIIVSTLLGLEPTPWVWETFALDWAGIIRLRSKPLAKKYIWALETFNRVEHLGDTHRRGF